MNNMKDDLQSHIYHHQVWWTSDSEPSITKNLSILVYQGRKHVYIMSVPTLKQPIGLLFAKVKSTQLHLPNLVSLQLGYLELKILRVTTTEYSLTFKGFMSLLMATLLVKSSPKIYLGEYQESSQSQSLKEKM